MCSGEARTRYQRCSQTGTLPPLSFIYEINFLANRLTEILIFMARPLIRYLQRQQPDFPLWCLRIHSLSSPVEHSSFVERVQVQRSLRATVQLRTNSFSVKTVTLPFLVLLPTRCFCSSLFSLSVSPEKATRRRPIKVNSLAKASMRENLAVRRTRKPPGTTSVSRQREATFFSSKSRSFGAPFLFLCFSVGPPPVKPGETQPGRYL